MNMRFSPLCLPALLLAALVGCSSAPVEQPAPTVAVAPEPTPITVPAPAPAEPKPAATLQVARPDQNFRSVHFDFDKADLRSDSRSVVDANSAYLRSIAPTKVRIEGNADERGSREYNLALGQKRAETTQKALEVMGVPAGQMEAISYGKEKPLDPGHNEEAWAKNRRADIVYKNPN